KHYFTAPLSMLIEKSLKAGKSVSNPFCIVEPVNRKDDLLVVKVVADLFKLFDYFRVGVRVVKFFKVNSQRKHFSFDDPFSHQYIPELTIVAVDHLHCFQEVLNVLMCMKPDEVGAEHPANDFLLPWF